MSEPIENVKENVVEPAAHPVETSKRLAKEADRGRSARTPAIALTGVTLAVAGIVAVVLVAAVIAYILA